MLKPHGRIVRHRSKSTNCAHMQPRRLGFLCIPLFSHECCAARASNSMACCMLLMNKRQCGNPVASCGLCPLATQNVPVHVPCGLPQMMVNDGHAPASCAPLSGWRRCLPVQCPTLSNMPWSLGSRCRFTNICINSSSRLLSNTSSETRAPFACRLARVFKYFVIATMYMQPNDLLPSLALLHASKVWRNNEAGNLIPIIARNVKGYRFWLPMLSTALRHRILIPC